MKKLLLTLCVSIALCGSLFAQQRVDGLDPSWVNPDWPVFNDHAHALNTGLTLYVQVNGEFVSPDNYENFVVAAFDMSGECRGMSQFVDETDLGDLYPVIQMQTYYDNPGESLRFEIYDHVNLVNYDVCNPYDMATGEAITILSGEDHTELWEDPEAGVVLAFTGDVPTGIDLTLNVNQWYLISSPVGTVDVADVNAMLDNTYDLYYFNQAPEIVDGIGLEWINYRPEDAATNPEFEPQFTELVAGQGYLYANSGDGEQTTVTITFPGSAYEGENVTVDLDYSTANPVENMRGWNLVGNPFNMQATIGDYPFYRMIEGVLMPDVCTGAIEAMEGVFVKASAEGENVTFAPYQSKKRAMLALNLTESGRLMDRAIVGFGEGRTLPKFQLNQNSSKVYITLDNEDYAVVRSEGMGELPVSFKAEANGNYSLSFSSEDVDFSYLHLIDNMTGADVDLLATPSYSFDARTTDYASRFRLVFATGSSADGDSFGFVNASGNLCIFGIEGEATLQVMDVTGRILGTETFSGSYEKQLNVAPGVYMLRLTNGNNVKVQKMVVR